MTLIFFGSEVMSFTETVSNLFSVELCVCVCAFCKMVNIRLALLEEVRTGFYEAVSHSRTVLTVHLSIRYSWLSFVGNERKLNLKYQLKGNEFELLLVFVVIFSYSTDTES